MIKGLTQTDRFRLRKKRYLLLKFELSGSGPRLASSEWISWPLFCHKTHPNFRGSVNLRICPFSKQKSIWSCFLGDSPCFTILKLPLMPRWISIVPISFSNRRYFPRRLTCLISYPSSIKGRLSGTNHLSFFCRTVILCMRLSFTEGFIPLRVVSTSGSSGNFGLPNAGWLIGEFRTSSYNKYTKRSEVSYLFS